MAALHQTSVSVILRLLIPAVLRAVAPVSERLRVDRVGIQPCLRIIKSSRLIPDRQAVDRLIDAVGLCVLTDLHILEQPELDHILSQPVIRMDRAVAPFIEHCHTGLLIREQRSHIAVIYELLLRRLIHLRIVFPSGAVGLYAVAHPDLHVRSACQGNLEVFLAVLS